MKIPTPERVVENWPPDWLSLEPAVIVLVLSLPFLALYLVAWVIGHLLYCIARTPFVFVSDVRGEIERRRERNRK